jgi:hypothetical protein
MKLLNGLVIDDLVLYRVKIEIESRDPSATEGTVIDALNTAAADLNLAPDFFDVSTPREIAVRIWPGLAKITPPEVDRPEPPVSRFTKEDEAELLKGAASLLDAPDHTEPSE